MGNTNSKDKDKDKLFDIDLNETNDKIINNTDDTKVPTLKAKSQDEESDSLLESATPVSSRALNNTQAQASNDNNNKSSDFKEITEGEADEMNVNDSGLNNSTGPGR